MDIDAQNILPSSSASMIKKSASPVKMGEYFSPEILVHAYQETRPYIPLQRTESRENAL